MRLLSIRQPCCFSERYVKTENSFNSFSLLCAVHIFQVEKVEAKMLLRKELEPTGYVTWEVPNNEKLLQLHLMMGQIQHIHRKF